MVSIGDISKSSGRNSNRSKSKVFTMLILGIGLTILLVVYKAGSPSKNGGPRGRSGASGTTQKLMGSFVANGSDQRSASVDVEYSALDNNKVNTNENGEQKIRQISLIGERNSGTRWTYSHLSACFNHSIPVERHLSRYKHWFQYENETAYPHDTLVIAQFRNPYDWFKAMQRVPHHSPSHLDKEWKEFITTPWTTPRLGDDIEIGKTITADINSTDTTPCQQNFLYQDIVSCVKHPLPDESYDHKLRFSEETPFYEMRPNSGGQPFANIMEMRSAKIQNMLDVQNYKGIAAVWAVQYEYLLQRGTEHMIKRVSEWTGIEPKCDPFPPQLRRERPFEKGFVDYVSQHLNWTAEELIGYNKYKRPTGASEEAVEQAKEKEEEKS